MDTKYANSHTAKGNVRCLASKVVAQQAKQKKSAYAFNTYWNDLCRMKQFTALFGVRHNFECRSVGDKQS